MRFEEFQLRCECIGLTAMKLPNNRIWRINTREGQLLVEYWPPIEGRVRVREAGPGATPEPGTANDAITLAAQGAEPPTVESLLARIRVLENRVNQHNADIPF